MLSRLLITTCFLISVAACQSTTTLPVTTEIEAVPVDSVEILSPAATVETESTEAEDFNLQFYQEAVTALKAEKWQFAVDVLQELTLNDSDIKNIYTNLGLALLQLNQMTEAQTAFNKAIEKNPSDAIAYNHLGIILRSKGQFEDARKAYQKAINLNQEYAAAHLNLGILFDIYLQNISQALVLYERYQSLQNTEDESVALWIVDIQRRIKSGNAGSNG